MKKIWEYVVAAFALILGLFLWEREKKLDAEAKLDNADTNKANAVLDQHTNDLKAQADKDKADAEAAKVKQPTVQDLLDFFNKDDKK